MEYISIYLGHFQNRSVQIYAFNHKYAEYTLNAISEALLNDHKIEFEGDISNPYAQTGGVLSKRC